MNKDYYTILGVSSGASQEEIQRAYENIVYNPSVNQSREIMFEVEEAYTVLSEPELRLQYDQIYKMQPNLLRNFDGLDISKASQNLKIPKLNQAHAELARVGLGDLEDSLSENIFETIHSIFSDIVKMSEDGKTVKIETDNTTEDVFVDLRLNHKEAVAGGYKALEYTCYIECSECSRFEKNSDFDACPKCNGGKRIKVLRRVEVKVPPKVKTGTLLKIKEEGNQNQAGLSRGDLLVRILISKK
ncbi:MAG: DnaJ domain-containing protein [Candidatus Yanofskybacteria bacterium]|nr:DnaJ domain-containing protein [Candidatus Yanofskybacteria bacterium]